ncbi:MAG: MAPEG family protein [Hyphomicrobiaceae bacterium]
MTTPQWTVLAFAAWTLIVLIFGVGTRRWYLILSGEAAITSFPADTPHGSTAYRRAMRAHANCVENLPVYAAIVLVAEAARLVPSHMDTLALAIMACRVLQSSIHVLLPETESTVAVRFAFFLAQVAAMTWMILGIVSLAIARAE